MHNKESSQPKKKVHPNSESYSQKKGNYPNSNKTIFILDQALADKMISEKKIYEHTIGDKKIYFPYENLHQPQKQFLEAMFNCL